MEGIIRVCGQRPGFYWVSKALKGERNFTSIVAFSSKGEEGDGPGQAGSSICYCFMLRSCLLHIEILLRWCPDSLQNVTFTVLKCNPFVPAISCASLNSFRSNPYLRNLLSLHSSPGIKEAKNSAFLLWLLVPPCLETVFLKCATKLVAFPQNLQLSNAEPGPAAPV